MPLPGLPSGFTLSNNSFQRPIQNGRGDVAFAGGIAGPGVNSTNDAGVFIERDGQLELLIREGDQIPDLPTGTFLKASFASPLQMNNLGQVVFAAELVGPAVDATNSRVLLGTDREGSVHTLLRSGDLVEVYGQGLQPITSFQLYSSPTGASGGGGSAFNDLGQVAVEFIVNSSNSGGILVTNVIRIPEPNSAVLLSALGVLCLVSRCKRSSSGVGDKRHGVL